VVSDTDSEPPRLYRTPATRAATRKRGEPERRARGVQRGSGEDGRSADIQQSRMHIAVRVEAEEPEGRSRRIVEGF